MESITIWSTCGSPNRALRLEGVFLQRPNEYRKLAPHDQVRYFSKRQMQKQISKQSFLKNPELIPTECQSSDGYHILHYPTAKSMTLLVLRAEEQIKLCSVAHTSCPSYLGTEVGKQCCETLVKTNTRPKPNKTLGNLILHLK